LKDNATSNAISETLAGCWHISLSVIPTVSLPDTCA